jgi:hypothetical protein
MRLVIVESPYAGKADGWPRLVRPIVAWWRRRRNVRYLRAALHDCIARGEAPFASHALYTQPGVLDDGNPHERATGIDAGLEWGSRADATVVYGDLGFSSGMEYGIARARADGRRVEYRSLRWGAR